MSISSNPGRWRPSVRTSVAAATALISAAALVPLSAPPAAAATRCSSTVAGDVNGDGHAEVVVTDSGRASRRGSVHVFYGTAKGLVAGASGRALDDQVFTQDTTGIPGKAENLDRFGSATSLADFNGDGCADLAIGTEGDTGSVGSVTVLYGSPRGITTTGLQRFTAAGIRGSATTAAFFGTSMVAADLDDDGVQDLAVGASGGGGAVAVIFGSDAGLDRGTHRAVLLTQGSGGVPGPPADELDRFGSTLAAGDFDGNGASELAVANPRRGVVQVLGYGQNGFDHAQPAPIGLDSPGVPGDADGDEEFGAALAAGDTNGDGRDELAVGAPDENCAECDEFAGEGAVTVLPGSPDGLTGVGSVQWTQDSPGVAGSATLENAFGSALAMGRLDGDSFDDLAVGAPGDFVDSHRYAGSVTLLLGSSTGLTTAGVGGTRLTQDTAGIAGAPEEGDDFGRQLSTAHVQGAGQANLVVSSPYESIGKVDNTGQVTQLARAAAGPQGSGSRNLHLDTAGVKGTPGRSRYFGYKLNDVGVGYVGRE